MTQRLVSEELLLKIEESLESRCGTNAPERREILPQLRELLEQPAVEPVAWLYWHPRDGTFDGPHTIRKKAVSKFTEDTRREWMRQGWEFEPLYTAPQAQPVVGQQLMRLLASAWFYGGWKAETKNEQDMETLMIAAGLWPFKDEAELLARIAAPQARTSTDVQQQPAPVQEPDVLVVWQPGGYVFHIVGDVESGDLLYKHPPQPRKAVKLTVDELVDHYCAIADGKEWAIGGLSDAVPFARAIEQAVLKKNGVTE